MKKRLPLSKGTILQSRYRVLRQLGHGGMGAVYEAADSRFKNRSVALKETYADSDETRRAFEREAHLLAKTEHEAFPRVMDYFTEGDGYFLVMELIRGKDLADLLEERAEPFEQEQVLAWADQLLDALDDLHSNRIIHRDIKPSNLKLTPKGRLKLLDFGIAKGSSESDSSKITTIGSLAAATLQYAPLEQVLKANIDWFSALSVNYPEKTAAILQRSTDAPSDLYALSATLYQLLTGQLPVNAPTRALAIWAGLQDKMLPAHEFNPRVSPLVSAFLQRGLELDRKERFHTAREMRQALQDIDLTSPSKQIIAELDTGPLLAEENEPPVSANEEKRKAIIIDLQNLSSAENEQLPEAGQSNNLFISAASFEFNPDESLVPDYGDEMHPEKNTPSNEINPEPLTEISTIIQFEESIPHIQEEFVEDDFYLNGQEQASADFVQANRLLIDAKQVELAFEPKLLDQAQGSYPKSPRMLTAWASACVITVLCVVIGMATFQQAAELEMREENAKESATSKPTLKQPTPALSARPKSASNPISDSANERKLTDSTILKTKEPSPEKIEASRLQKVQAPEEKRPAKLAINVVNRPVRLINQKKAKSKPSPNSDCIFEGKC